MKETASQRKKDKVLRTSMYVAVLIGLAGFLIFSILAAITFGNADLSLKDVYSVIAYKLFHIKSLSAYAEGAVHDVVWLIRLPRVLLALAVGMALSVCGVVMQAIVQNPLADPCWVSHLVHLWVPHWPSCLESEAFLVETLWESQLSLAR